MSALSQRPSQPAGQAENDVYTILLIIATIFIVIGTVCLAYQFHDFYGLENLFHGSAQI